MKLRLGIFKAALALMLAVQVSAQQPKAPAADQLSVAKAPATDQSPLEGYELGLDDQIMIRALDAEEISEKPVLVGIDGYISLPMVGRVKAAGLTVQQLEAELVDRLKPYIREPQVSVAIVEFRSQPVSVMGSVGTSGVVQLRGNKTLFEVISAAGGLRPEAGNTIKITRRREFGDIPLPSAVKDETGEFSIAEVDIRSVMEASNPQENIVIKPFDVISVPKAELVYVIGAVRKAGGFVLNERDNVSVLQALSMAEGLDRMASAGNARILRSSGEGVTRTEIPIDVNKILSGKVQDVAMQANDILFIPNSAAKNAALRTIEAAIQIGTGIAIFR
jgi:polysaccharide export outer membrane protein